MQRIKESGENYLETILILKKRQGKVRSVDIVEELGYSKSSVSRAVNLLKEKDCISIDGDGYIEFTEAGEIIVKRIYERHKALTSFLMSIGVPEKIAEEDACRIEHVVSEETMNAIKRKLSGNNF